MLPTEPLTPPDSQLNGWAPPALVFTPNLELRSRIQLGGVDLDADEREVASLVRMGMVAERGTVSAGASFQIVRSWEQLRGENTVSGGFFPALADGWIAIDGELSESVRGDIIVGRQSLRLHEGRLLGADHYNLDGLYLDALVADIDLAPFHFRYMNARRFGEPNSDPLGLGVNMIQVGAANSLPNLDWMADVVWFVDARHTDSTSYTGGLYSKVDTGRFGFRAESYWQSSALAPMPGLSALLALRASWIFGQNERLKLTFSGELAEPGWEQVLGGTRDFWGYVDVFSDPSLVRTEGMKLLSLEGTVHPVASLKLGARGLRFREGTELDGQLIWYLSPLVSFELGGGYFWADPGYTAPTQGTGWVELDAKF